MMEEIERGSAERKRQLEERRLLTKKEFYIGILRGLVLLQITYCCSLPISDELFWTLEVVAVVLGGWFLWDIIKSWQ